MKKIGLCGHSVFVKHIRGVCSACYNRYNKMVREGRATWAALEAEGRVSPKQPKKQWTFRRFYR